MIPDMIRDNLATDLASLESAIDKIFETTDLEVDIQVTLPLNMDVPAGYVKVTDELDNGVQYVKIIKAKAGKPTHTVNVLIPD